MIKFSKILLFAHDAKIYEKVKNITDYYQLQSDIEAIARWYDRNAFRLNIDKCHIMNNAKSLKDL